MEYLYSRAVFWSKQEPEQLRSWKWNHSKRHPAKLNGRASQNLARTQADKLSELSIVRKHASSTQLGKDNELKNMKTESKLKDKSQPIRLENGKRNTINVEVPNIETYIEQMNNEDSHENMTNKDILTSNTAIETQLETTDTKSQFEHGDDETHSVNTNESEYIVGRNEDETNDTNTTHLENTEKQSADDRVSHLERTENEIEVNDSAKETRLDSPNNDDSLENMNNTISAQLVKDLQLKLEEIENGITDQRCFIKYLVL